jgi:Phage terminase, small subunit
MSGIYRWADATPGNTIALKHGAWSPRKIDPLAAEIIEQVTNDLEWLRPCDRPALHAWARAEARIQLLSEFLAERGDLDDDGSVRPAADLLTRLETQAAGLRSRLGLDPLSRARLGRDVAASQVDLARLWAADAEDSED